MKKILLLLAGHISLILGILGIFLPILPTTPFLLLSAVCFMKSSEKMYLWLINHKVLGLYVRSYIEYKAISLRAKILSIAVLWLVMMGTVFFFITLLWIQIFLTFIAIGVTVYLIQIKTLTTEMLEASEKCI